MKYFLIGIFIFGGLLRSQPVSPDNPEIRRRNLIEQQIQLSLKESLLRKRLAPLQKAIDSLQRRSEDRHQINAYQKKALILSKRLIILQAQQDSLKQKIKQLNALLYRKYTQQLDSLRQLPKARTAREEKQRLLLLNQISRKRLEVSPELENLPFDLQKLSKLEVNQISNPLQKTIVIDYLHRALQVINTQYDNLRRKKDELRRMQRLRQKALSFENEIDGGSIGPPVAINKSSYTPMSHEAYSDRNATGSGSGIQSPVTAPDLTRIDQLIRQSLQMRTQVSVDSVLSAIQQAQNILRKYREMIQSKLKQ